MRPPEFVFKHWLDELLPLCEEQGLRQGAVFHLDADGRYGLRNAQYRVHVQLHSVDLQHPVEFSIDLEGDEADADVRLDPALVEVEYRSYLQLGLRNPERLLDVVELVVGFDDGRRCHLGVADVALQPVPLRVVGHHVVVVNCFQKSCIFAL